MAGKPRLASTRAEPASHAFAIRNAPGAWWSARNRAPFSLWVVVMTSSVKRCPESVARASHVVALDLRVVVRVVPPREVRLVRDRRKARRGGGGLARRQ